MFSRKAPEKRPLTDPNGGHPFRTPGINTSQKEEESMELEDMPKFLFAAECKPKSKAAYGTDYFDVLANNYNEVLKFLVEEMKYDEDDVKEIRRRGIITEGTSVISYKH